MASDVLELHGNAQTIERMLNSEILQRWSHDEESEFHEVGKLGKAESLKFGGAQDTPWARYVQEVRQAGRAKKGPRKKKGKKKANGPEEKKWTKVKRRKTK